MPRMGRPKLEHPKLKTVGVRVTCDEYRVIKEYATRHNMTMTEMVLKGVRYLIQASET